MPRSTKIGWTQATWNPWTGCVPVSAGCDHCYAERLAERFRGSKAFPNGFRLTVHPERFEEPLSWQQPREIFVCSMSDFWLGRVPVADVKAVWETMLEANWHTFQILTKRPVRARQMIADLGLELPSHIWLGVSVEDQAAANHRIPTLLEIPAEGRFLSCEPLLGPVDLKPYLATGRIHWVIDGGESGPGRRPAESSWFRCVRDQCLAAGVIYYHKQGNHFWPGRDRLLDGRTWDGHPNRDPPSNGI